MQMLYGAVPTSHWDEVVAWLHKHGKGQITDRVKVGEVSVFGFKTWSALNVFREFCGFCNTNWWPYNVTYHNDDVGYWPANSYWRRYDHQGNVVIEMNPNPGDPQVREVLHTMVRLEKNDPREKDRLFHVYLLNTDFADQAKNAQLAQMRSLLGAD